MEIPVKMNEVLKHEGVVAIVSQGESAPHVVNTWNSYITLKNNQYLLIPVGGMKVTESNITKNKNVFVTLGSREVEGFRSKGTGFLITATAEFIYDGAEFDSLKERFPWRRAVLRIKPATITQTL